MMKPDQLMSTPLIDNRYQLIAPIGHGGMGTVYRVYDRLNREHVALKQVHLDTQDFQLGDITADTQSSNSARLALALEFRTMAGLRHPHIVSVMDYGFDADNQPFFTMELLENTAYLTRYAENVAFVDKVRLVVETLQALAYLHRRGIIHRDMKPANVLVADDMVKVMDFGLAMDETRRTHEAAEGIAGTLSYMAPELFQNTRPTVQSDLYALGMMMYEIFVGHYPFNKTNIMTMMQEIRTTQPDVSKLPAPLAEVLLFLLAKTPDARPRSAEEVLEMVCLATDYPQPEETDSIRESYLQASRFVGRERELNLLRKAVQKTMNTQGSAWLIGGESGVGKSRLIEEVRTLAMVEGALVVVGQGAHGGHLPYHFWRDPVRRLILATDISDLEAGILQEFVSDIGEILARDIPPAPLLSGADRQHRLIMTIVELFRRVQQPMLLVLEDLHWAIESIIPLQQLLKSHDILPHLMIVATYRDDERPNLPSELPEMSSFTLHRLQEADIRDLSLSMLGEVGQRADLVELITRETEGNALFIVEVVRALAETAGSLRAVGQMALPTGIITGGLKQVLEQRLAHIPPWALPILKLAAVIGREIDLPLLTITLPKIDNWGRWLRVCGDAAILEVQEKSWRFRHDKFRETLLASLNEAERMRLHRHVAQAIEDFYPDSETYAAILYEHWRQAGEPTKELHYGLVEAERLLYSGAHRKLVEHLEELLVRFKNEESVKMVLMNLLGDAYEGVSRYQDAINHYNVALELAKARDEETNMARALVGLGKTIFRQGDFDSADYYLRQALAINEHNQHPTSYINNLHYLSGVSLALADYPAASHYAHTSLALAETVHDQNSIGHSYVHLGTIAAFQNNLADAETDMLKALHTFQQINNAFGAGLCYNNLGWIASERGDYPRALSYLEEAVELHKLSGNRYSIANAHVNMAFIYLYTEMLNAPALLENALRLAYEVQVMPVVLEAIAGYAYIAFQHKAYRRTAELIGFVINHPSVTAEILNARIQPLMLKLDAAVRDETLEAALEDGKALDLATLVAELLSDNDDESTIIGL